MWVASRSDLLTAVVLTLLQSCGQFSELSNRHAPTIHDALHTFELLGMPLGEFVGYTQQIQASGARRRVINVPKKQMNHSTWENPMRGFLTLSDYDGEENGEKLSTWSTLMHDIVPNHLPSYPPRHTWMFTPVYATEVLSDLPMLQLVNRKLDNARLVETSLRKLIKQTDKAVPMELWNPTELTSTVNELASGDRPDVSMDAPETRNEEAEPPEVKPVENRPTQKSMPKTPLPRAVNYKTAWYTTLGSADSKLPTSNLYTARLRGMDDTVMSKRQRRYVV